MWRAYAIQLFDLEKGNFPFPLSRSAEIFWVYERLLAKKPMILGLHAQKRYHDELVFVEGEEDLASSDDISEENSDSEYEENTDSEEEDQEVRKKDVRYFRNQLNEYVDNLFERTDEATIMMRETQREKRNQKFSNIRLKMVQAKIDANEKKIKQEEDREYQKSIKKTAAQRKRRNRNRKKKRKPKHKKTQKAATPTQFKFESGIETTWSRDILERKTVGKPTIV